MRSDEFEGANKASLFLPMGSVEPHGPAKIVENIESQLRNVTSAG